MINLVKMLILEMLSNDDEPLNLILDEAIVGDDSKPYINFPYNKKSILQKDIKEALKELKKEELIMLLDSKGKKLSYNSIDDIINSNLEWEYWFRITEKGEKLFKENYSIFFNL